MVLGQYGAVWVDIWCYWVSKKRNWLIYDNIGSVKGGAGSVWGCTGWYLVVLGQSYLVLGQKNLVPIGIEWNWVSTMRLCLRILKKVETWSDVTIARQRQEKIELLSQWTMDGWDEQWYSRLSCRCSERQWGRVWWEEIILFYISKWIIQDQVNYGVSENEVGCDYVDKDDKGDVVTQPTGRQNLQGKRLYWAVLVFTWLFWTQWTELGCSKL